MTAETTGSTRHAPPSLVVDQTASDDGGRRISAKRTLRTDIQLLRAWAVIAVILNHAGVTLLPGGFLGVDIFFVVSGYLMTGLLDEALSNGTFSFGGFYARRTRRLLPAAYTTFVATAVFAPYFLESTEYRNFVMQLVGGFSFSANVVLWKQIDYFRSEAVLKPLLHIWSLSLEEQYYFFLPMALYLCPARLRLALSVAVVAVSAALCAVMMNHSPSAAFYLAPSRVWELAIGSVVAMAARRELVRPVPMRAVRAICAAILLLVPTIAGEAGHPGLPALIVCLATAVLLVPGLPLDRSRGPIRLAAIAGDWSYSLYLVHWPLLAFARNTYLASPPPALTAALVVAAVPLAGLQYRFIEQRFRHFAITPRSLALLLAVPAIAIGVSAVYAHRLATADTAARSGGEGLASVCAERGASFSADAACISGPSPDTLVWGDSFAMAAAPGIAAATPNGIVQATQPVCGPFLNLAPVSDYLYNAAWARRCIAFNDAVLAYLGAHPSLHTVVLATPFAAHIPGAEDKNWRAMVRRDGRETERPLDAAVAARSFLATVDAIHALGRRVVLLAPPPTAGLDVARCQERLAQGKRVVAPHPGCLFTVGEYHAYRRAVRGFVALLVARGVPVLDLDTAICGPGICRSRLGGVLLYRDKDHLSGVGSVALSRAMDWRRQIAALAR